MSSTIPENTPEPATAGPVQDQLDQTAPLPQDSPSVTPAATWPPPVPARPTGPHLPAIVLGLACLIIAVVAVAQEVGGFEVNWGDVGPLGIVAVGAVLVVLGLVGLRASRRSES